MTWEEAQKYLNGSEVSGPARAKVRREAWGVGHYVYRGGWPLFHLKEARISYPGFAKVVYITMLGERIRMRIDTWRPSKEDLVAADWMLL